MKITMRKIFDIENEYGINLTTDEGKEGWLKASIEMNEFITKVARPFSEKVENKEMSEQQLLKRNEIFKKLNQLDKICNYERLKYFIQIYSYFVDDDKAESENMTRLELEKFIEKYESAMTRFFEVPANSAEENGEEDKKKDRLGGM
jgi:predicted secreted protein